MSGSEDENENFCYFGKPLDPYDEDSFPKKRPISVEEQIATDAQGRRRFHGAFTGGFSAGFFNTVGSLEGWTPNEFRSSRTEKAMGASQKPEDFMDEEDLGEYGIAPQVVRATSDYNTSRKRKKQVFSDGPIPGEPVLHSIITSGNETVGYMLLKNLGIKDKIKTVTDGKVYGCQMPETYKISEDIHHNQYDIPKIYKEFLAKPKDNTFGLGYVGLDKNHFSLFPTQSTSSFVVTDKNNKKISITGQAFGVGAFEEDDDDIYVKDDMTRYDFELTAEKSQKKPVVESKNLLFDMFVHSKTSLLNKKIYQPPQIPHSFTGKHKVRRSRFEPVIEEEEKPSIRQINPIIRARYLGEETNKEHTQSKSLSRIDPKRETENNGSSPRNEQPQTSNNAFDIASLYLNDKFVSSSKKEELNILEPVERIETIHGTEQMREAVRMKMFGGLTRISSDWVPCVLLCKRFNVPEPFVDRPEKSRTRTKNIIFEYQQHKDEESNLKPGLKKEEDEEMNEEEVSTDNTNEESNTPSNAKTELENNTNQENIEAIIEVKTESLDDTEVKDITEKIDIEKHQDLFKAVFLSSDSESENEEIKEPNQLEVDNTSNDRREEMKNTVLSDQLIPKIKPLKEGILSGVNFHQFSKPSPKEEISKESEQVHEMNGPQEVSIDPELYGPRIPEKVQKTEKKEIIISSGSDDEWIEKDDSKSKKGHKKGKKHKKDKKKKSKHEKKKKYKD